MELFVQFKINFETNVYLTTNTCASASASVDNKYAKYKNKYLKLKNNN